MDVTLDVIVQFVRNGLCCVKDLNLLPDTDLWDPAFTAKFYTLPGPYLSQTTPLEVLICITQLYASVTGLVQGWKMIFKSGLYKLLRLNRVAVALADLNAKKDDKKKEDEVTVAGRKIVTASIMEEADNALRETFVGLAIFLIGITFIWLSANSLHITEAKWIGGVPGLIHALEIAELSLIPILYYMYKDAKKAFKTADIFIEKRGKYLSRKNDDKLKNEWLSFSNYTMIVNPDFEPFWREGAKTSADRDAEAKMLEKAVEGVESDLKKVNAKDYVLVDEAKGDEIDVSVKTTRMEGYRHIVYFLLNFIAMYGYAMGILAYYFTEEKTQPQMVRKLMFEYSNSQADWGGNFAGDLMWTVEPIIIMFSGVVIAALAKSSKGDKKEKSD